MSGSSAALSTTPRSTPARSSSGRWNSAPRPSSWSTTIPRATRPRPRPTSRSPATSSRRQARSGSPCTITSSSAAAVTPACAIWGYCRERPLFALRLQGLDRFERLRFRPVQRRWRWLEVSFDPADPYFQLAQPPTIFEGQRPGRHGPLLPAGAVQLVEHPLHISVPGRDAVDLFLHPPVNRLVLGFRLARHNFGPLRFG